MTRAAKKAARENLASILSEELQKHPVHHDELDRALSSLHAHACAASKASEAERAAALEIARRFAEAIALTEDFIDLDWLKFWTARAIAKLEKLT